MVRWELSLAIVDGKRLCLADQAMLMVIEQLSSVFLWILVVENDLEICSRS